MGTPLRVAAGRRNYVSCGETPQLRSGETPPSRARRPSYRVGGRGGAKLIFSISLITSFVFGSM